MQSDECRMSRRGPSHVCLVGPILHSALIILNFRPGPPTLTLSPAYGGEGTGADNDSETVVFPHVRR